VRLPRCARDSEAATAVSLSESDSVLVDEEAAGTAATEKEEAACAKKGVNGALPDSNLTERLPPDFLRS
jgi:hypothetical protein